MRYNIVDSIKGGCGKTSFSLMLASALYNENKKQPPCLFDMDFQGTSLAYLLFGKEHKDWKKSIGIDMFLNERVVSFKDHSRRYIKRVEWKGSDGSGAPHSSGMDPESTFYVAMADPDPKMKDKYKARSNQNYSPEVTYGIFRYGLAKLLEPENLETELLEKPGHVILDMPPNIDGYSDAALGCILNNPKQNHVNYFIMMTFDQSHIHITMDWFKDFLTKEQSQRMPERIFFTFALTPRDQRQDTYSQKKLVNLFTERTKWIRTTIDRELNLSEEERDRIYFVVVGHNDQYYRLCCEHDGITNYSVDISMPVILIEDYKGNLEKDKATKVCIKVMNGGSLDEAGADSFKH